MRKRTLLLLIGVIIFLTVGIPLWVIRDYLGHSERLKNEPIIKVLNHNTKKVMSIPLEQYLIGVVAAEMPAEFEMEALKAQAVVARTYAVKRMFSFGRKPRDGHFDAEICTDPAHCQAWITQDEMEKRWGRFKYFLYLRKIKNAVEETRGLVITYNGEYIDPVYHASCGGKGTENSEDVWANEVPYLRHVKCDWEHGKENKLEEKEIKRDELLSMLEEKGIKVKEHSNTGTPLFSSVVKTSTGRIKALEIAGHQLTGSELRNILGLNSTYIDWKESSGKITVKSTGKGHAVGLCQYGTNGLAEMGKTYREIIEYYYTGVQIKRL